MSEPVIHQCTCSICQSSEPHPTKKLHHQTNVLLSRLNEQQRRWYAALEARRQGLRVHYMEGKPLIACYER